jgi:hypothetical protein
VVRLTVALLCALSLAGCGTGSSSEEAFAQASRESAAAASAAAATADAASASPEATTTTPAPSPTETAAPPVEVTAVPPEATTATPSAALSGRFTGGFATPERLARILEFGAEGSSAGTVVTGITNNFVELVAGPDGVEFSATVFATVEESCGTLEVAQTVQFVSDVTGTAGRQEAPMAFRVASAPPACSLVAAVYDNASTARVDVLWQFLDRDRVAGTFRVLGVPGARISSEFRLSRAE